MKPSCSINATFQRTSNNNNKKEKLLINAENLQIHLGITLNSVAATIFEQLPPVMNTDADRASTEPPPKDAPDQ